MSHETSPFDRFFFMLRSAGVPVGVTEWLTFLEALKAGIIGEKDHLTGVAENIIVGQPISLGTGSVALYYIPEE